MCIDAEPGEVGEAIGLIKDDARHNYTGYADKAASERKILRDVFEHGDAWFRTGDLMRQDEDGYFYFVDRIGDTFRWKGENVSTTEVAEVDRALSGRRGSQRLWREDRQARRPRRHGGDHARRRFKLEGLARLISCANCRAMRGRCSSASQPAIETTGTFKYRKVDLVRDGFDPAKIEQALYFDHPDRARLRARDAGPLRADSERRVQALTLEHRQPAPSPTLLQPSPLRAIRRLQRLRRQRL